MISNERRGKRHPLLHHSLFVACVCAVVGFSLTAKAQSQPDRGTGARDTALSAKSPEDARFYGFLFPGGGQYYLGENRHGAAVTAKSIALLGAGTLTLLIDNCTFHFSDQGQCTPHRHLGQVAIGSLLIAAGAWVWARGAVEAGRSAQQTRTGDIRSRTTIRPIVDVPRVGSVQLGFSMRAGP